MSSLPLNDRVTALAGLVQALSVVQRLAETGHLDARRAQPVIESVYRLDIDHVNEAYGGLANLRPGLETLDSQLLRDGRDSTLMKLMMSVLAVERSYSHSAPAWVALREAIKSLPPAEHPAAAATWQRLARLYAEHISPLNPKVMVHGNPNYLSQDSVVAEVRALLLAALRSAVLWRQLGGRASDFLLKRSAMRHTLTLLIAAARLPS